MKRVILKKKIIDTPKNEVIEAVHELHYLPALQMEPGEEYVNNNGNCILTLVSIEPYEGALTGMDRIHDTIVNYKAITDLGVEVSGKMNGNVAVIADEGTIITRIRNKYEIAKGIITSRVAANFPKRPSRIAVTDKDGKLVVTERKPRGEMDTRTGCTAGSQGHILGLLMLQNKCSPTTRGVCIAAMTKCLETEFGVNPQKSKSLASSWYSTNYIRKPLFYQKKW